MNEPTREPTLEPVEPGALRREVGLPGAVLLGLGSIVGTGVFVSIGIAAGIAGPAVVLAAALAGLVAALNGLSSAQLAAAHPVSGGTYEYAYRLLDRRLGFTAGWMFLCAKSASAATAGLGFAGYLLQALGVDDTRWVRPVGLALVVAVVALVLGGIRRSNRANAVIVGATLLSLLLFVAVGLKHVLGQGLERFSPFFPTGEGWTGPVAPVLHGTALMFVAYTGYGRIATLGEEVHEPRRTIPRAIVITLVVSVALYVSVAVVGVGAAGADGFAAASRGEPAPLAVVAAGLALPGLPGLLTAGALTAMLAVALNLVLGLSRVLLAMARRGDVPRGLAALDADESSPTRAVLVTGALIAGLVLVGDVKTTWSFSAFTVLVYYALTNLSALRLPAEQRLFPRAVPAAGLVACLGLAFWVERPVWIAGCALIAAGLVWHAVAFRARGGAAG